MTKEEGEVAKWRRRSRSAPMQIGEEKEEEEHRSEANVQQKNGSPE